MVERRADWIGYCISRQCGWPQPRKWPCRDDGVRSAEFGHVDENAATERNVAAEICYQNTAEGFHVSDDQHAGTLVTYGWLIV